MGLSGRKSKWVFADSGPTHLTRPGIEIDWDNEEHRRCITACLVKATYVLEKDRTTWREGKSNARAPAWWESFHFRRLPEYDLEFKCKCKHCKVGRLFGRTGLRFIYGAVFQYAPPPFGSDPHRRLPWHHDMGSHLLPRHGSQPQDPVEQEELAGACTRRGRKTTPRYRQKGHHLARGPLAWRVDSARRGAPHDDQCGDQPAAAGLPVQPAACIAGSGDRGGGEDGCVRHGLPRQVLPGE